MVVHCPALPPRQHDMPARLFAARPVSCQRSVQRYDATMQDALCAEAAARSAGYAHARALRQRVAARLSIAECLADWF